MRAGAGFANEMAPSSSLEHGSTWHSPVPYLFGGLAAMFGLIAFALLILACSYWKVSAFLEDQDHHHPDPDTTTSNKPTPYLEQGFVVIMAGDDKPTFLATPVTARPISPFGIDDSTTSTSTSTIAAGKVTGEAAEEGKGQGQAAGDHGSHQH